MPIKIPDQLPAHEILVREGVSVMDERTALRQDIRPLQIGLLNLMPNKIRTETQFARLDRRLAPSGRADARAHRRPQGQEHVRRAPDRLLPDLGRGRGAQVRRLHHHGSSHRAPALRRGYVLERVDAHPRLDDVERALLLLHLLGSDGGRLAFPRHSQIHAGKQGFRCLPAQQQRPCLALSGRLLGRFRHSGFAMDGGKGGRYLGGAETSNC